MRIDIRRASILLKVLDMPLSVHFYRDVLGFEIVETSPRDAERFDWALLRAKDAELMLETICEARIHPTASNANRASRHLDLCLYFGCPEIDAVYEHLLAHGVDVHPPRVAPYGMKQLYVIDPDSYLVCLQWPAA